MSRSLIRIDKVLLFDGRSIGQAILYVKKGGSKAIQLGRRGRRDGDQRTLSTEMESQVKRALIDKTPDQLKLPFALWMRDAVKLLIKQRYGIEMPIRTVGEYLKRWGFTPQKPVKRAYEQNTEMVKKWMDTDYPVIATRAKKEKAEIHWGDETGIQTGSNRVRGFAPKGETPVIRMVAKKSHVSMISANTNQGKVRFMMYRDAMNSELLIKFMTRLTKDAGRKVFLILDNLRVHHSKDVKHWLKEHQEQVEVFYLPSYSPELNPDEYLNGNLKSKVHSGAPIRNREDLKKKTRSFMRTLVKRPAHVRSYFKHPKVVYAA
jgi:transposase